MENNSQSLEISKENHFADVRLDLMIEICMRFPVKSVARFLLLSKFWVRSMSQPRLQVQVVFMDLDRQKKCQDWSRPALLISLGYGLEKCIANPSTDTSTVLGRVQTSSTNAQSFFGYDQVNDEYKLLVMCMSMNGPPGRRISSNHQVVTLGAKNKPWRMIDYITPHQPVFNSVCIDGVLYYVAFTGDKFSQVSLMRFNLRSEKLDIFTSLSGKVALATKTPSYKFELWILDQHAEAHGWLKKSFSINSWKMLLRLDNLFIRSTTHTGDFILAPRYYSNKFYVIHYNPDTNSFRESIVINCEEENENEQTGKFEN
ncbi:hypothetical protein ARALYDRAFT_911504 [Arabidopsis lyrata subsp. lyrata]|uniref:F-box associated beta-propeller type 3 domain-containing protein n=1 Tax=Arabidopsis lyrata subsp. lyrata TaxID=81972 RepID=D7LZM7_ARALL|nr:hypothetical protein ARALYDRAFT_911504 [Arabidopsis lyrata subsp. lyrata]